jgi:hypothetical protein
MHPPMPTLHREAGLRFVVWPNDHRPPHVHAFTADGEAVIDLDPVALRAVHEMRDRDVARALEITKKHEAEFLRRWRGIHG